MHTHDIAVVVGSDRASRAWEVVDGTMEQTDSMSDTLLTFFLQPTSIRRSTSLYSCRLQFEGATRMGSFQCDSAFQGGVA